MATTYPATDSDLSYCFSTAVAAVGSASALGLRATVPVYPSSPSTGFITAPHGVVVCVQRGGLEPASELRG
jgi:hypothetical protein